MLSDITLKYTAQLQLSACKSFNDFAREKSAPTAFIIGLPICVLDTLLDTLKYPLIAIENIIFSLLNLLGASCFQSCSLLDAGKALKSGVVAFLIATPVAALFLPYKLFARFCVFLPNPRHLKTSNADAEKDAALNGISIENKTSAKNAESCYA